MSALLMSAPVSAETPTTLETSHQTTEISNSFTATERRVRNAAVRVLTHQGHGSGGLIKYRDIQLVLTAQHVAEGSLGDRFLVSTAHEQKWGILIHQDRLNDIAVLYIPVEFEHAEPMRWRPNTAIATVGQQITYSGHPSWHSLLSFRGHVAGFETHPEAGQQIILQTYGYFGCSGSVVYDDDGKIVGILWGIDVSRSGVQENIVWVSPIQNLNLELALVPLCNGLPEKPRACR